MKLKKILAVAVGLALCVGGEAWGAEKKYYKIPVVVQPGETAGEYDVFFMLLAKDVKSTENPIFKSYEVTEEPQEPLIKNEISFTLSDDNMITEQKNKRLEDIGWTVETTQNNLIYPINTATLEGLKKPVDGGNYLLNNVIKEHSAVALGNEYQYTFESENLKNFVQNIKDVFIDKNLVDMLLNQNKTNLKLIRKAAIDKFEEKKGKVVWEKEPKKKDDKPEENLVKAIGVLANPQGDVFFVLDADLTEKEIIFNKSKVNLTEMTKDPNFSILFDANKTDNCYYIYIIHPPTIKDINVTEKEYIYLSKAPPANKFHAQYNINSNKIPKLTELKNGNYLIPEQVFKNIPIIGEDKSPLKDRTEAFIDGKIVDWLNKEGHLDMIKNAAIKKFKEPEADLNNLANTLYKLALPAH